MPKDNQEEESKISFDERLKDAVTSLEGMSAETALYDRDALLGTHSIVTEIAQDGFNTKEIDQAKSIEVKHEATKRAIEIAKSHGDEITAISLGHLAQVLENLLTVIAPQDTEVKAATTSKDKSSAAKT